MFASHLEGSDLLQWKMKEHKRDEDAKQYVAKAKKKEPSWHRRERKQRSYARTLLRVEKSREILTKHHGSQAPSLNSMRGIDHMQTESDQMKTLVYQLAMSHTMILHTLQEISSNQRNIIQKMSTTNMDPSAPVFYPGSVSSSRCSGEANLNAKVKPQASPEVVSSTINSNSCSSSSSSGCEVVGVPFTNHKDASRMKETAGKSAAEFPTKTRPNSGIVGSTINLDSCFREPSSVCEGLGVPSTNPKDESSMKQAAAKSMAAYKNQPQEKDEQSRELCPFCKGTGQMGFSRCTWCQSMRENAANSKAAYKSESQKEDKLSSETCSFCKGTGKMGFSNCVWCNCAKKDSPKAIPSQTPPFGRVERKPLSKQVYEAISVSSNPNGVSFAELCRHFEETEASELRDAIEKLLMLDGTIYTTADDEHFAAV